jgi:hypothetical protein
MVHKAVLWISVLATIAGVIIVIVEKTVKGTTKVLPPIAVYSLIIAGTCLSVILALTEKDSKQKANEGDINASNNQGTQINITHPGNNGDINIGDQTTTAENRFKSACQLIQQELISNFITLKVLIEAVENIPPEHFWDKRKPNESEDTYQERAKNFHRDYQTSIFQRIQKFPIHTDVFSPHKLDLDYNASIAMHIQQSYENQKETVEAIQAYSDGLLHNLSLNYRDSELMTNNISLQKEKIINAKIAFLTAESDFLAAYPDQIDQIADYAGLFAGKLNSSSPKEARKSIWQEMGDLSKDKTKILESKIIKPQRNEEIDRIIKDPYLLLLRRTAGLPDTLTVADAWALTHKKIQKDITESTKLLSAAAMSYIESDGLASKYYLDKALTNNDFSNTIRLFIEKSIDRLNNPDKYDGSIGLIIMELGEGCILKTKRIQVGDVLYKMNGEIVNDPADISSLIAKTKKEDNILFTFSTLDGKTRNIAINGSNPLNSKVSQLIILNAFQL